MGVDDQPDPATRVKDGREWRIGSGAEVAWIRERTFPTTAITAAIPPVFDAYATLEIPGTGKEAENESSEDDLTRHDRALLALLSRHTTDQPWWLGYLDTGADDIVFHDAPRVELYAHWSYVLVEAGLHQAGTWRQETDHSFWAGALPNVMLPRDHSLLVSTMWDDDWTCIGGPLPLVNGLLRDVELGHRARKIDDLECDATPPGHQRR